MQKPNVKTLGLIGGPLAFALILAFFHPEGLSSQANAVLASAVWIAVWWTTEALPLPVTSLLPIILLPLTGGLALKETTVSYGHRYIFLYIGGFILAITIEKWKLHKRIALTIINFVGSDITKIVLGFMVATAFMSMWISNTATTVMMLPIGIAIVAQLRDNPLTEQNENELFGKVLMLAIAYSASIGGVATLIGTPPNLVLAGILQETYGIELTFSKWIMFGLPVSLILLFVCWIYLTRFSFDLKQKSFPGGKSEIQRQLRELGKMSYEEKLVLTVFVLTALMWITRSFVFSAYVPALDDTIIAITSAILLFVLPSRNAGEKLISWEDAVRLPWGILLLFGGGMALAAGFQASGLAAWFGGQIANMPTLSILVVLLILVAAVNFLTEITSNLATTAMLLPILAPMALSLDIHPFLLMVGATVAASCAFMLPVATPPNAVVFGSGFLKIGDMMKTGIWMNIISIAFLTAVTYFLLPLLWNFDLASFPKELLTK